MIVPVRCFTCGKLIGDKWEEFKKRTEQGEEAGIIFEHLGIKRYCCKRMLLSHVDIIDDVVAFFDRENIKDRKRLS